MYYIYHIYVFLYIIYSKCTYLFYKYQLFTEKRVVLQDDFYQHFMFLEELLNFINNLFLHRMNVTLFYSHSIIVSEHSPPKLWLTEHISLSKLIYLHFLNLLVKKVSSFIGRRNMNKLD